MRLKKNSHQKFALLLWGAGLLAGCGSPAGLPHSDPGAATWVFPVAAPAARPGGRFPDRALVAQVAPGLRDVDLLQWFGVPDEGYGQEERRAGEWDYIFHFHSGGGVTTCRCKVVFDSERIARSFHWQPAACGDWLSVKTPVQAQGKAAP